jgi:hypothetical protein
VAHLRKFRAPVWVLLQGQAAQRKMLPKSKRRAYVGYEEGPKAVQYYNAEMRKVLTSRNYRFLSPPTGNPTPEAIAVAPDAQCEGERDGALSNRGDPQGALLGGNAPQGVHSTNPSGNPRGAQPSDSDSLKRKRTREDNGTLDRVEEPRIT